jgi:hypothetical protein
MAIQSPLVGRKGVKVRLDAITLPWLHGRLS